MDAKATAAGSGNALCPRVEAAFELLAKKWNGLIINSLLGGQSSFNALAKSVPSLSPRLLSIRLKELEGEGIVFRQVLGSSPVRVVYGLTPKGRALEPVMRGIADWARAWPAPAAAAEPRVPAAAAAPPPGAAVRP